MKIFQIGFNKCGTVSLHKFFLDNGLKSIHWDNGNLAKRINQNYLKGLPLLKGYEDYDCFTDMECQKENIFIYLSLFRELDRQYPGSKFILNVRDKSDWIKSRIKHRDYLSVYQKITSLDSNGVIKLWETEWDRHLEEVKNYFENRESDLLIFDIESDVQKLFEFMSEVIKVKCPRFGHYNKTKIQ
jgi:hypothetical protein